MSRASLKMSPVEGFTSRTSKETRRRLSAAEGDGQKPRWGWASLTPMYAGISTNLVSETQVEIGVSVHDGSYTIDYSVQHLNIKTLPTQAQEIEDHIIKQLISFSTDHLIKFVGAGVTQRVTEIVPTLCSRLWKELDIVPLMFNVRTTSREYGKGERPPLGSRQPSLVNVPGTADTKPADTAAATPPPAAPGAVGNGTTVKHPSLRPTDEQADSAVRKAVMYFGPSHTPRLSIGYRNQVEVDAAHRIHIVDQLSEFKKSVREPTWNAVMKYGTFLRENKIKIGFFSSTPQGGGVALMRHAMIRFMNLLGVDAAWYVPKPSPAVFRTTKNNHNILQSTADPNLRITQAQKEQFTEWITYNAERYWLSEGGPLAKGGVDVAFIDDPQMPGLIPLIKKARPELPVIYRSHIEIRSDLAHTAGTPQQEVWQYLWDRIQHADLFISHPVASFVPSDVPIEILGLMPATTDWLDGLSKPMREWDLQYYMRLFRSQCSEVRMSKLHWPARSYICQVARFDPAKGIPVVIDSFAKLRRKMDQILPNSKTPQLLLCGHGAVDDPDAAIIYDEIMKLLEKDEYAPYASDVVVMRIGPSDQMLNALMSNAKVVLQLSSREGFEVKVSEAIHKGKPIIATKAGGIPLQVQHGKNGFLVDVGDSSAVAKHLYDLWTDDVLYNRMSAFAKGSVSDEVGTLGNAASWMYLACKFASGEKLKPHGRWINDMMREEAGEPYKEGEPKLPRTFGAKAAAAAVGSAPASPTV